MIQKMKYVPSPKMTVKAPYLAKKGRIQSSHGIGLWKPLEVGNITTFFSYISLAVLN